MDQHLYELPLVARKRLSWLWAFSGVMPWAMLDEPTLGQDRATRAALADAIARLSHSGYGVVFITHDDDVCGAHRAPPAADCGWDDCLTGAARAARRSSRKPHRQAFARC